MAASQAGLDCSRAAKPMSWEEDADWWDFALSCLPSSYSLSGAAQEGGLAMLKAWTACNDWVIGGQNGFACVGAEGGEVGGGGVAATQRNKKGVFSLQASV